MFDPVTINHLYLVSSDPSKRHQSTSSSIKNQPSISSNTTQKPRTTTLERSTRLTSTTSQPLSITPSYHYHHSDGRPQHDHQITSIPFDSHEINSVDGVEQGNNNNSNNSDDDDDDDDESEDDLEVIGLKLLISIADRLKPTRALLASSHHRPSLIRDRSGRKNRRALPRLHQPSLQGHHPQPTRTISTSNSTNNNNSSIITSFIIHHHHHQRSESYDAHDDSQGTRDEKSRTKDRLNNSPKDLMVREKFEYRCDGCGRIMSCFEIPTSSSSKNSTPAYERPSFLRQSSSVSFSTPYYYPGNAISSSSSIIHQAGRQPRSHHHHFSTPHQHASSLPHHHTRSTQLSPRSRRSSISEPNSKQYRMARTVSMTTDADESEQIRRLKASIKAIARVCRALRNGDLNQMIDEDVATPDLENLKADVNSLVFKVCSDVGQKGLLGKQADLEESSGIWRKMLVDVNSLASNLSAQVRDITEVTTVELISSMKIKIEVQAEGEILRAKAAKIYFDLFNRMVDQLNSFATEVARIAQMVGTDGILDQQITVDGVEGVWKDLTDSVNSMASNLTSQVRSISAVTSAIARGDLSQQIEVEAKGEMADLKKTFLEEVGRVAREVGVEGVLGGQANVPNVEGAWYDLSHSVNQMANNLTSHSTNCVGTRAVAEGDLSQEVTVQARGEVAALASTVNGMVTRVALLTGTEGVLGGKAEVANVSGEWKTLVDRKLTDQVREIARVTTAVADGDLTNYVTVDARGEIGQLRDTVNAMVRFLQDFNSEVTRVTLEVGTAGKLGGSANVKHARGEWHNLVTGLNRMVDRVTGQVRAISRSTAAVAKGDLSQRVEIDAEGEILQLAETINAMLGRLNMFSTEVVRIAREIADGNLNVRAEVEAVEGVFLHIISEVNKMSNTLSSQVGTFQAITDAAAAGDFSKMANIAAKGDIRALQSNINTMVTKLRTAFESNVKAKEAAEAHSLAKSQFLANTSHEIRTPLNAIIGLTFDTLGSNLTREQRENLNLVRGQADALLRIINDILDITKIEAGRMALEKCSFSLREVIFEALTSLAFGAATKSLDVFFEIHPAVPDIVIGDGSRLGQVIKNLVGNSQKFTPSGSITLTAELVTRDCNGKWKVQFHVIDTGIGIEKDKLQRIFGSFMQADGSVTRKYGGTGLGLTISRNLVQMMGGHLDVESEVGKGSDFMFDVLLGQADQDVELRKQIEKVDTDQCVLLIEEGSSEIVETSCVKFGLSVQRVRSIDDVPSGDLYDCAIISTIEEADRLRSNRFLPLVLRAPTLPRLNMRRALDFSLASVIETDKGEAELCNALNIALKKSMRKLNLLAEDNKINQIVARRLLASSGLKCIEVVENGEEAFEAVKSNRYDIVLMDVSMPVKDGREATEDIRRWEKAHSVTPVPIIGVTAHALVGDREKCMKAGMSGVCTKPLLAPELVSKSKKQAILLHGQYARYGISKFQ
ncbi:expressed protein [Phakopsora pachyrhizi]|uniref:histidine kinase n=1 Tax=Phakopsora pachyrhizi TaxID=170000 RepID=A0AAV0BAZ7_PHAPC|nr:expressed protein [Phakopsora pachyrhizi]